MVEKISRGGETIMEFTQGQKDAVLKACNDRCFVIKELIMSETKDVNIADIDMARITVLTVEYNDLQGAMTQLALNGAVVQ